MGLLRQLASFDPEETVADLFFNSNFQIYTFLHTNVKPEPTSSDRRRRKRRYI